MVERALPTLCQVLDSTKPDESWVPSTALELLNGIIEGVSGEKGLGEGFFSAIAPPLFKCLSQAEDRDVVQVRYYFSSKSVKPVLIFFFCRMESLV